jgi:hypothetical protein
MGDQMMPVPQSGVGPPGPIPNPVVKHTSARWYCPARAGEEAGAGIFDAGWSSGSSSGS